MTLPRTVSQFLADLGNRYAPFLPPGSWGLPVEVVDRVFVDGYVCSEPTENRFETRAVLVVFVGADPLVPLPAADFLTLTLGDETDTGFVSLLVAVQTTTSDATVTIDEIPLELSLAGGPLHAVELVDGRYRPTGAPFVVRGRARLDLTSGFDVSLTFPGGADVPAFMIGDTGLVCEVDGFDFTTSAADPALAVDRVRLVLPDDLAPPGIVLPELRFEDVRIGGGGFSGVVNVTWPLVATAEDPGRPYHYAVPGEPAAHLFGLPGGISSVQVTVEDNAVVASELAGSMLLPWFEQAVAVAVRLGSTDGELDLRLEVRAEGPDPDTAAIVLTKAELLSLHARSIALEASGSTGVLTLSGGLQPLLWQSEGLTWPRVDVTGLRLEQDLADLSAPPVISFDEAWVDLAELATLDLFGFLFELERIGVGYLADTDELWIDLTGSVRLIDQLPVGLGVDGFRITWPRTLHEDLLALFGGTDIGELLTDPAALVELGARIGVRFAGVHLFYGVPGTVELEGLIRFVKDAQAVGFAGDMALRVPATGLALEAGLLVGMNLAAPPFPFLYVYFGIELPAGIPLGPSGLALKGARGLFGLNVRPDRTPEQNPYHDWYKRGPLEGAHPTTKWTHERWAVAFGAGVTITTVDGTLLGVRGLLVIALPGPVVFVEGKALVFQGVFPGDGPLSVIGFFDGAAHTVQLNVQVAAELVAGVLDVDAGLEAFFDFDDPTAWHLYLGQDKPADRRVAARILDLPGVGWLFSGSSYLMLDMADGDTVRGRAGVEIVFEPPAIEVEVVTVRLSARLDGTGDLTLNPFAFDGGLALDAALEIDAYGLIGVSASATATVRTHGPRPLVVHAGLHVGVELPVPDLEELPVVGEAIGDVVDWFEEEVAELPEIPQYLEFDVPFHMEYPGPPTIEALVTGVSLLRPLALAERSVTAVPADADERRAAAGSPVVGLDALPVVSFAQDLDQAGDLHVAGFPGPAARFTAADLRFAPTLRAVELHSAPRTGTGPPDWELVAALDAPLDAPTAMWASWRPDPEPTDPARTARRVLQCGTANPFVWLVDQPALEVTGPTAAGDTTVPAGPSSVTDRGIELAVPPGPQPTCVGSAELEAAGPRYRAPVPGDPPWRVDVGGVGVESYDLEIERRGGDRVLLVSATGPQTVTVRLRLPEPAVELRLRLGPDPAVIDVRAYRGADCAARVEVERTTDADGRELLRSAVPFRCVEIWAKHPVEVLELCWIAAATARDHATASAQAAETAAVVGAGPVAPLLAADRYYRLSVTTSVQLVDDDGVDSVIDLLQAVDPAMTAFRERYADGEETTSTWLFQTDGPPRDLDRYVAWASVAGDAPVYADDDLVFRFRRSTLEQLYPSAVGGITGLPYGLDAVVTDAQGRSVPGLTPRWRSAGSATELPVEHEWRALVDGQPWGPVPAAAGDDLLEYRTSVTLPTFDFLGSSGLRLTDATLPVEQRVAALLTADGPPPRRGEPATTGCVLGWQTPDAYYVGGVDDHPDGPRLRLARRSGSATVLLAERPLHEREQEQLRSSGLHLEVHVSRSGPRLTLAATLDHGRPLVGTDTGIVSGADTLGPLTEGRVGILSTGPRWLAASRVEIRDAVAGLGPGGRYRLWLVGGEGGRALVDDRFDTLDPRWDDPASAWQTGDGTTAAPDAPLWWRDTLDDVEVHAHVELHAPDTLAVVLRHPAGRTAAPRSFYEVTLRAGAADTVVTSLRAGLDDRAERVVVAATVRPGPPGHHTLRVRLLADRLRAWLDEQPVLDETLGELALSVGAPELPGIDGARRPRTVPVPPTPTGRLGLRVLAGAPRVRRLRLAPPTLAEWTFETAGFRSLAALVGSADGRPRRSRTAEPLAEAAWTAVLAAAASVADARIDHRVVRVDHHDMVRDRTALEAAALAVRNRESALDQAFDALLAGHPLPADRPTALEIVVLEAGDAGDPFAILVIAPETLDPAVAGDPGEHRAAPGTGRTSVTLQRRDGTAWTDVASRAVATADGTRLLLRPVDDDGAPQAALQPGTHRLRCTRIRDHGDDQAGADVLDHRYDRPRLAAGGRTGPETAMLELEV